jgi:hypothetical protein
MPVLSDPACNCGIGEADGDCDAEKGKTMNTEQRKAARELCSSAVMMPLLQLPAKIAWSCVDALDALEAAERDRDVWRAKAHQLEEALRFLAGI